jgi:lipopolysaccharide exporter
MSNTKWDDESDQNIPIEPILPPLAPIMGSDEEPELREQVPVSVLERTVKGAGWVVGWRMTTRGLGFINSLVLARILDPKDFGLVAVAGGIIASLDALSTTGVDQVLIREKTPDQALYNTAFTMEFIRGLANALILVILAWPLSVAFKDSRLAYIMIALSLGMIFSGFENIKVVDFRRDMQFRKEFMLQVGPRIIMIFVTIIAAALLENYWALVIGILSSRFLILIQGYIMKPYMPSMTLSCRKHVFSFSFWSWLIAIVDMIRIRSDSFILQRFMGADSVGLYGYGTDIAQMPTSELVDPLCRVCFSAFAEERHSSDGGKSTYVRIVATMLLVTLPAGLGVSMLAAPIVYLALGQNYLQAIPIVQLVGASGSFGVVAAVSATLFSAHAMLGSILRLNSIFSTVRLLILLALIPSFGLWGAGLAVLVARAFDQIIYLNVAFRRFKLKVRDLVSSNWRGVLSTGTMCLGLWEYGLAWHAPPTSLIEAFRQLATGISIGALIYTLTLGLLWMIAGRPQGPETDMGKLMLRVIEGRNPFRRSKKNA